MTAYNLRSLPHRSWLRVVLLTAVLLCFAGCSFVKQLRILRVLNKGNVSNKHFADSIPYDKSSGWIVLKAQVSGSNASLDFIFDTGAFCTVSNTVADSMQLKRVAKTISGDVNKTKGTVGIYRLPPLLIGRLEFLNTGAVGYNHPPAIDCMANGGILGSPMIREAVWHIDLRKKTILVTDDVNRIKHSAATQKLHIETDKFSRPYVTVNIGSTPVKFLFDIGANQLMLMPEKKALQFTLGQVAEMIGDGVVGAWGSVQDTLKFSTLSNVELFGRRYQSLPMTYSNKTNLPLIGNKILDFYAVTLDLKNETIYLEEYSDLEAYTYRSFGFDLEFKEGKVYVSRLIRHSVAEKSGLHLGDEITAINNQPAAYSNYCSFQGAVIGYFKNDRIAIERKGPGAPKSLLLAKEPFSE